MAFRFEVWPTEYRQINQYFGANPQNYTQFGLPGHEGLDIMAPSGSKIFVVAPGHVKSVRTNPTGHNYGIHVRVEHEDGYETIYAHLQEARVQVGQTLKAGDLIGLADNTGNSFGSHLHLTLKKTGESAPGYPGDIIDPTPFLLPLLGFQKPAGPYTSGFAYTNGITIMGDLAQVNHGGINLRSTPSVYGRLIDIVPSGTIMIITGPARGQYTPVDVPTAALANVPQPEPEPTPPPADNDDTVDGWGYAPELKRNGETAVVNTFGINLRATPSRNGHNIGIVRGGSTVTPIGTQQGEYLPIRVRRTDFTSPINLPDEPVVITPPAPGEMPTDAFLGWAFTQNLTFNGNQVISGRFGTMLRNRPSRFSTEIGIFPEDFTGFVVGKPVGEYTPVVVSRSLVQNIPANIPPIQQPEPLPDTQPIPAPSPSPNTTPGWAFTTELTISGGMAVVGRYGINLRSTPRRDPSNKNVIGFVPGGSSVLVTGAPQGEYTPVRVDDAVLQPPFGTTPPPSTQPAPQPVPQPDPDPPTFGQARLGLHASADPDITDEEVAEFKAMRPGIIKILSSNNPDGVRKLATQHPNTQWIVRAFLDFRSPEGVRNISPQQFFEWTINDVKRALGIISTNDVVIELHNEPNLVSEGLGGAWQDGESFAKWWLKLLSIYRKELPDRKFIYPGLSPGYAVTNIKHDHIQFAEASRDAIEAADGLGVHLYWSNVYPMSKALDVLDDYINRFRYKPIWVTEASNNKAGTSAYQKARQYLSFWTELQQRPTVAGVTYFVASASDPKFKEEVWVGRGIGKIIGRR
ncbi:MAG: hypothetical protein Kow0080_10270 [Candidatus Promineifilaceae bacterium]